MISPDDMEPSLVEGRDGKVVEGDDEVTEAAGAAREAFGVVVDALVGVFLAALPRGLLATAAPVELTYDVEADAEGGLVVDLGETEEAEEATGRVDVRELKGRFLSLGLDDAGFGLVAELVPTLGTGGFGLGAEAAVVEEEVLARLEAARRADAAVGVAAAGGADDLVREVVEVEVEEGVESMVGRVREDVGADDSLFLFLSLSSATAAEPEAEAEAEAAEAVDLRLLPSMTV